MSPVTGRGSGSLKKSSGTRSRFRAFGSQRTAMSPNGRFNMHNRHEFSVGFGGTGQPRFPVPPKATDSHHHIYDARYPVDPSAQLQPPDATVADYRALQRRL